MANVFINTDFVENLLQAKDYFGTIDDPHCVIFHDENWFGITCLNDNVVFKISLTNSYESLIALEDGRAKELWFGALDDIVDHRRSLAGVLTAKKKPVEEVLTISNGDSNG